MSAYSQKSLVIGYSFGCGRQIRRWDTTRADAKLSGRRPSCRMRWSRKRYRNSSSSRRWCVASRWWGARVASYAWSKPKTTLTVAQTEPDAMTRGGSRNCSKGSAGVTVCPSLWLRETHERNYSPLPNLLVFFPSESWFCYFQPKIKRYVRYSSTAGKINIRWTYMLSLRCQVVAVTG